MEGLWGLITIVGPILLAAALIYGYVTNKKRTKAERDLTERATREQYKQPDRPYTTDRQSTDRK